MNASPTEYDIIFVGIENVLCDFIAAYSMANLYRAKVFFKWNNLNLNHTETEFL